MSGRFGSHGAISGARMASVARQTTTTPPNSASCLRLNARQNALTRSSARSSDVHTYLPIDNAVRDIGEQVRDEREHRHEHDVANQRVIVCLEHRLMHKR